MTDTWRITKRGLLTAVAVTAALAGMATGGMAEEKIYEISLKDAVFTPQKLKVPADTAFIIKFTNGNAAPAEFESNELKIEKIVAGNSEVKIRVRGMPAGVYLFFDEFQQDVAKGLVIVE